MQQLRIVQTLAAAVIVVGLATAGLAQVPASGPEKEAADAYQAYLKTVAAAKSLKEVMAHLSKEALAAGPGMPETEGEEKAFLELIQVMMPKDIKITGAKVEGQKAELTATGTDEGQPATGTITMVQEDGRWKLVRERWHVKSGA
jgi:ketosteroid isomerase-like protein